MEVIDRYVKFLNVFHFSNYLNSRDITNFRTAESGYDYQVTSREMGSSIKSIDASIDRAPNGSLCVFPKEINI